jgi:hypothetical protein
MPARTTKIRHDDETRAKIQAAQIINRMHSCLMGKITLDAQQVSCAKALLNKVLPDLSTQTHAGDPERPIYHKVERVIVRHSSD